VSGIPDLLEEFSDIPLVAISDSQRRWGEEANWVATIHHGLPLQQMPFREEPGDYLAFVGRITPEKGITDVIELARRTKLPLKMAAKVYDKHEQAHFDEVVQPAIDKGIVEFLGEVGPLERDPLYAGALATMMLGAWPEPFGLVAIESLTETIEHGIDGFLVDDLTEAELAVSMIKDLDRTRIRERALERFSPERMTTEYEAVYTALVEKSRSGQAVLRA
jgi:glycosyltransferase involved in cell wall biosynthesis